MSTLGHLLQVSLGQGRNRIMFVPVTGLGSSECSAVRLISDEEQVGVSEIPRRNSVVPHGSPKLLTQLLFLLHRMTLPLQYDTLNISLSRDNSFKIVSYYLAFEYLIQYLKKKIMSIRCPQRPAEAPHLLDPELQVVMGFLGTGDQSWALWESCCSLSHWAISLALGQ